MLYEGWGPTQELMEVLDGEQLVPVVSYLNQADQRHQNQAYIELGSFDIVMIL